jgi:tRNA(adenine34) deaminase
MHFIVLGYNFFARNSKARPGNGLFRAATILAEVSTGAEKSVGYGCIRMAVIDFSLFMKEALNEALRGSEEGEVPVGAVVVTLEGKIAARAHNQPIALNDPTAHAEILALRKAGAFYGNYRLEGSTLVVTVEPCLMCVGAALHARISRIVFGAYDAKWGAAGSLYNIPADERLNHKIEVVSGVLEGRCLKLMQDFFQSRRK